ncbi:MAG: sigma-70 family RNA polymerase sigma factor [Kiloniellales bacterium]|nr:sigma-70 family RNA polymerase sigma factor [Kiloniellales bacterium]
MDRSVLRETRDPPLAALLAATAAGDEAAFGRLYAATSPRLFAVILRIVVRRDWAEEVLQEVYLTIWDRAGDYCPDRGAPMAWLTTIGRNRALDRFRRKRDELPLEAIEGSAASIDPEPSPLDWALAGAEARRLKACLDRLELRQRDCIVMAMVEGYSHSELSSRFDCPLGTVKSWIRRGLQRLKLCLEQ